MLRVELLRRTGATVYPGQLIDPEVDLLTRISEELLTQRAVGFKPH